MNFISYFTTLSPRIKNPRGSRRKVVLNPKGYDYFDTGTRKKKRPEMSLFFVVPTGIEPVTQGFSVLCSTN